MEANKNLITIIIEIKKKLFSYTYTQDIKINLLGTQYHTGKD